MPLKGRGVLRRKLSKENQYTEDLQGIPGTSVFPSNDRGRPQEMGWPLLPNLSQETDRWETSVCRNVLESILNCVKLAKASRGALSNHISMLLAEDGARK